MINIKALRNKLINAAIQGKLTEQLPEDGTAEELFEQIQIEKQAQIKAKKIKKEKPLPPINEDKSPFEVPSNWKWVYLGSIFQHNSGKALNAKDSEGDYYEYITTSNVYWDKLDVGNLKRMRFTKSELEKCTIKKGDLLVCEGGDIGRSAIWSYDYGMRIQNHIHRLRGYINDINSYFYYYVMRMYKHSGKINGIGIGLQGLSSNKLHSLIIPLPPLAEQKRIVAKLDELNALLDTIDCLQKQYNNNRAALKRKLIEAAIQGKLTEQLPEDGTAEELFVQIQAEKQAQIKAKKIKKEKLLPPINEDEVPFEVPKNWIWCKLKDITSNKTLNDGDWVLSKDMVEDGPVKLIQLGNIGDLEYRNKNMKYLTEEKFNLLHGKQIYPGYLLINRMVSDRMFVCILPKIEGILITAVDVCWIAPQNKFYEIKYLMYMLASSTLQKEVKALGYGVTRFRISKLNLINIHFPLPPLAEQKRIVAKLDELLAILDG